MCSCFWWWTSSLPPIALSSSSSPIVWSKVTMFLWTICAINPEDVAQGKYRARVPPALLPRLARVRNVTHLHTQVLARQEEDQLQQVIVLSLVHGRRSCRRWFCQSFQRCPRHRHHRPYVGIPPDSDGSWPKVISRNGM